jgi:hypothetical protein
MRFIAYLLYAAPNAGNPAVTAGRGLPMLPGTDRRALYQTAAILS